MAWFCMVVNIYFIWSTPFINIYFVDFFNTDRAGLSTKFGGTCNGSTTKFLFRGTYEVDCCLTKYCISKSCYIIKYGEFFGTFFIV
jgi:hypothetical protein